MAYLPIAGAALQYMNESTGLLFDGGVLKGYKAGTSTPLQMATDAAGGTLVDDMPLNSAGYSTVSGNMQIPHFNEDYKLFLYPTQAAANANSGEIWSTIDLAIDSGAWVKGADLESATELLVDATGNQFDVTGTVPITSFESRSGNDIILLQFDGALTLTHHAINLILPGGANILTKAGDIGLFYEYAAGDYRLVSWNGDRYDAIILGGIVKFNSTIKLSLGSALDDTDIDGSNILTVGSDGNTFSLSGTQDIDEIATVGVGTEIEIHHTSARQLTHDGTKFILPSTANITTASGDVSKWKEKAAGEWRCTNYEKANGRAVLSTIPAGSVDQAAIGAAAVGQAELKTTSGAVSTTATSATLITLPGGTYGFYPQVKETGDTMQAGIVTLLVDVGTTYLTRITLRVGSSGTVSAQQRYIQASPPYDLGNGAIPLFILAEIDNVTGNIISAYVAEDPPWANNGPTNIRPDFIGADGKHYQRVKQLIADYGNYQNAKAEYYGVGKIKALYDRMINDAYVDREVTQALKQADMKLIPHPFGDLRKRDSEGNDLGPLNVTVVMLDPLGKLTSKLQPIIHDGGAGEISEILHSGYMNIGNTDNGAKAPPGVMPVDVRFK